MNVRNSLFGFVLFCFFYLGCDKPLEPEPEIQKILIFSKTEGYRHASISSGKDAFENICLELGIQMDTSEDSSVFTDSILSSYNAVVFLNTTGDILDSNQEAAFERFIQNGGGFIGVHAATDTEYQWAWYGGLVGAYFNGHPSIQEADLQVQDHQHPATEFLPMGTWTRTDEWYNFRDINPGINPLVQIDESSYSGGNMGAFHPISWYHEYDGGKAFYTGMGHTKSSYQEPLFLEHLKGGLLYVM